MFLFDVWVPFIVLIILVVVLIIVMVLVTPPSQNPANNTAAQNPSNNIPIVLQSKPGETTSEIINKQPVKGPQEGPQPVDRDVILPKDTLVVDYHEHLESHNIVIPAAKINLFVEYYLCANESRQEEIDFVISHNLRLSNLDHIYIVVHNIQERISLRKLINNNNNTHNTVIMIANPRPTYGELFHIINYYAGADDINILTNSDIAFDRSIEIAKKLRPDEALALSRYNLSEYILPLRGEIEPETKWTQDAWIIRGKAAKRLENINFTTGLLRCDSRLAYILVKAGYKVFNPCYNIYLYHAHKSAIRNYTQTDILPGKGAFVPGCSWI